MGDDDEDEEDEDTNDVDSDFELDEGEEPTSAPGLGDFLLMAKLYGHDGFGTAPPDNIIWDRRWIELHPDATLWHADEQPQHEYTGMLGRLDLADVFACDFTVGRNDELCLSQPGKCHLLRADVSSATHIRQWHDAILKHLRSLKEGVLD